MVIMSSAPVGRTAAPEVRRRQFIEAAMTCIARAGIAATTVHDVAAEAGLSSGSVNLHFGSKDRLLEATLEHLSDDYQTAWEQALSEAGDAAADQLTAMINVDWHPSVCERRKLAVWFAFWGEAQARGAYRRLCNRRDRAYTQALETVCRRLADEAGITTVDAATVALTLSALSEGLWLDVLVNPRDITRRRGRRTMFAYLAGVFPEQFGQD